MGLAPVTRLEPGTNIRVAVIINTPPDVGLDVNGIYRFLPIYAVLKHHLENSPLHAGKFSDLFMPGAVTLGNEEGQANSGRPDVMRPCAAAIGAKPMDGEGPPNEARQDPPPIQSSRARPSGAGRLGALWAVATVRHFCRAARHGGHPGLQPSPRLSFCHRMHAADQLRPAGALPG